MKRDGRSLDHQTLEAIRLMAVERVREGEPAAQVIAAYGFNRTTIYKWLRAARRRGLGLKALRSTSATGRPRSLTPAQERQVFRWVNGRDPRQYGLDFGLWTRAVVAELIGKKFGIQLGVTAVGALLANLGLTPQKPLQRAYQRDPEAIEQWQRETYPALARQAKAEGAEIYFWDESGFRADTVHGKTWGVRGHTRWWRGPATAIVQRRFGSQCQRGILVLYLRRCAQRGVVHRAAATDDEVSPQAASSGAR
jgi:transposase